MTDKKKRNRPQVLLVGNGIDICGSFSNGKFTEGNRFKTEDIIKAFCEKSNLNMPDKESNLPFPLQFEQITAGEKTERTGKFSKYTKDTLKDVLSNLSEGINSSNSQIAGKLLELDSDAILTTNYTYTLEKSLSEGFDEKPSKFRRYTLNNKDRRGENGYLLHTFYDMQKDDAPKRIWHIHGEIKKPDSIILGHYGYFKLIGKILEKPKDVEKCADNDDLGGYISWPDLFVHSDLYVLGYSFDIAEIDMWGLLSLKRNAKDSGSVVFYEVNNVKDKFQSAKWNLLRSKNVEIEHCNCIFDRKPKDEEYYDFYCNAIQDIKVKMGEK